MSHVEDEKAENEPGNEQEKTEENEQYSPVLVTEQKLKLNLFINQCNVNEFERTSTRRKGYKIIAMTGNINVHEL